MTVEEKGELIAEGEAEYREWRAQMLADPARRARYEQIAAKRGLATIGGSPPSGWADPS